MAYSDDERSSFRLVPIQANINKIELAEPTVAGYQKILDLIEDLEYDWVSRTQTMTDKLNVLKETYTTKKNTL
jgi:hypothetical protein